MRESCKGYGGNAGNSGGASDEPHVFVPTNFPARRSLIRYSHMRTIFPTFADDGLAAFLPADVSVREEPEDEDDDEDEDDQDDEDAPSDDDDDSDGYSE
jgi:hypothetical protein